MQIEQISR